MEIQQESFGEKLNEVYVLYFFVIWDYSPRIIDQAL
jgi:hypothetical protein